MRSAFLKGVLCGALLMLGSCNRDSGPADSAVDVTSDLAAITHGVEAGSMVGNVGTLCYKVNDTWYWFGCSGTLVHPRVFLSAGHCIAGFVGCEPPDCVAGVTFAPSIDISASPWLENEIPLPAGTVVHGGVAILHPGFDFNLFYDEEGNFVVNNDNPDLGIVVLDEAVRKVQPATIAPIGSLALLSRISSNAPLGIAGYGLTCDFTDPDFDGCPVADWGTRRFGAVRLQGLFPHWAIFTHGPSWPGSFDSGGPTFPALGALTGTLTPPTNVPVVFTTTTAVFDDGTASAYRLDTKAAHDFLDPYLRMRPH